MSTLKSINVIHPSSATNNIVNDASGNVAIGNNLTVAASISSADITTSANASFGRGGTSYGYVSAVSAGNNTNTGYFAFYTAAGVRQAYIGYIGTPNDALNIETDTGSNKPIRFGVNATEVARFDTSGNLLVGTTSSTAKLTVNGYVAFTGQSYAYYAQLAGAATTGYVASGSGNWSIWCSDRVSATEFNARSDARLKKDVTNIPISDAVNFVKNVPAVHYKWKNSSEDGHKFGFLAQDVVKAGFPNLVGQYPNDELKLETDVDGFTSPAGIMLTVNYDQIIPLLSTAIKELSAKNDALEARLAALEAK
jgi:hypothetical protein